MREAEQMFHAALSGANGRTNPADLFAHALAVGKDAAEGPNWHVPSAAFDLEEAKRLSAYFQEHEVDLDAALALQLLRRLKYQSSDFQPFLRFYHPDRRLVIAPERTCEGMTAAGKLIAQTIADDGLIAVYCDYDLDGTAAGAVLKRAIEPYQPRLHYGWADAQRGFGLTSAFVREAAAAGATLLITLDCGTGQSAQVKEAQQLGMKVIVVDHHHVDPANPAEHHLNPKLADPPSSQNTGAQLAWKLAAAVQQAIDGRTRPEHWEKPLHLAGMGALADMGGVLLPENRAFFWCASEHAVPGVRKLSELLGEDPSRPGRMILTQACLNMPKRTPLVDAADIGRLLASEDPAEIDDRAAKLASAYEEIAPHRKRMVELAVTQAGGQAARNDDGTTTRPDPDRYFSYAIFPDEFSPYAGYSGPIASGLARATAKPAVVFVFRGEDEHGQRIFKFSARNSSVEHQLGELIEDEQLQQACLIKREDESGTLIEAPSLGGHDEVVSGACLEARVDQVIATFERWAADKEAGGGFYPPPWDGYDAYLLDRRLSPERLRHVERQTASLSPFADDKQLTLTPVAGKPAVRERWREPTFSVCGRLRALTPGENDRWLEGTLVLTDDSERSVMFPADTDAPADDQLCEWVIRLDGSGDPWYLRKFHPCP